MATRVRQSWRSFFSTWRLDADYITDVSFPFSAGFGCGAAMKITQGQKLSLQTSIKTSAQVGGKLSVPGAEINTGFGAETTETLVHEFSASYEWSYSSQRCEYCHPRAHFPQSRIQIITRFALHLPLFVSRRTIFSPGETYEIRGDCSFAPDKCAGCKESDYAASGGGGGVISAPNQEISTHMERVVFAERRSLPSDGDR